MALWVSFGQAATAKAEDWAIPRQSPQAGGISAFAAKSNGVFYECQVNGNSVNSTFTVESHGTPGLGATGEPSAHYNLTNTDLYVFTRTQSGNLYLRMAPNAFNNSNAVWSWSNLGTPSGVSIASDPASVSYGGSQYAFVVGSDQRLYVAYGAPWAWSDQGAPAGVGLIGRPSTLAYDGNLYVFLIGDDGKLHTRYWNGIAWKWGALGAPASGTQLIGSTAAVTKDQTIHVFAVGTDNHLYMRFWNGSSWSWYDQGVPPQGLRLGPPTVAWMNNKSGDDLHVFAINSTPGFGGPPTNKLIEAHWDQSTGWELTGHGNLGQLLFRQPAIAGAFNGPMETWPTWNVNVFVRAQGDRIYRRMYSPVGGIWQWSWASSSCQM